ncbi:hypothetical protein [Paracoccus hibiscisoli]|uniref:hypothetical protein n=1 Tax=Paracoccus hibiscisoli TaxID=2023261 RepID=UPI00145F141B|nr:hypothetical protein [Paracoccus hibiscisoli]
MIEITDNDAAIGAVDFTNEVEFQSLAFMVGHGSDGSMIRADAGGRRRWPPEGAL